VFLRVVLILAFTLVYSYAPCESYTVKTGDTLTTVFKNILSYEEIMDVHSTLKKLEPSFVLKPGMSMELLEDEIILRLSSVRDIRLFRNEGQILVNMVEYEEEL
jgi:hypothetical protein